LYRRTFLSRAVLVPLGAAFQRSPATLTLHPERPVGAIPADYTGLSYETSQLSQPDFFSSSNTSLVALFRLLSPHGVLRLGGNSSDFCWWKPTASTVAPVLTPPPGPEENNWMPHALTAITPEAIDHLAGFLDATGWSLIYGLNLGTGTPRRAAEEAAYVANRIGPRLQYLQIGNEPEYYRDRNNRLRPPSWNFAGYLGQWLQFARAVSARLRGAKLAGPDVGSNADWVASFARQAPLELKGSIVACTGHYYAMGPPDDPGVTIERLLRTDQRIDAGMSRIMPAARDSKLAFRMTEGNSCYRGGKPGVSNTFASALWAADYMLYLARLGCCGVNFHGGTTRQIRAALGDHLPGEAAPQDQEAAKSGTYYTPIAGSPATGHFARPIYYGMLMANQLAGATLIECGLEASGANASAHAAKTRDGVRVALFNKDASHDLQVEMPWHNATSRARVWRLTSPALDATAGVRLAGAEIHAGSVWRPGEEETLKLESDRFRLNLPRASGALVSILE
jgi:hypothetical protein